MSLYEDTFHSCMCVWVCACVCMKIHYTDICVFVCVGMLQIGMLRCIFLYSEGVSKVLICGKSIENLRGRTHARNLEKNNVGRVP